MWRNIKNSKKTLKLHRLRNPKNFKNSKQKMSTCTSICKGTRISFNSLKIVSEKGFGNSEEENILLCFLFSLELRKELELKHEQINGLQRQS